MLSDIPEYDGLEEEDFPPLPPPHSPGQGGGQEDGDPFADGEEGEVSRLPDVPAAKRKSVKRPQPKLDSQRLISERGLPALRTLFDNVRFKGKGHEAEDLRLLMQKMENWAHRLYPKLQFEDFIDKVEKLGGKKEVQTCLKRIRLDMPLTHEDFMGDQQAPPDMEVYEDPDPFSRASAPVHSTPVPPVHSTPATPALTEEQRRRMELNKQQALERRLARQQQPDSQTISTSEGDEAPSVSAENVKSAGLEADLDPDPPTSMNPDPNLDPPTSADPNPPTGMDMDPPPPADSDPDPAISSVQHPDQPLAPDAEAPPTGSDAPPPPSDSLASPDEERSDGRETDD